MTKTMESYRQEARRIMQSNNYMVIATVNNNGNPWAATVLYVYDKDYSFYFLSSVDSRHAKNITEDPNVSFVIFDSDQAVGESEGIQAEGLASLVGKKSLEKVIKLYSNKVFPNSKLSPEKRYDPTNYGEASEFRFFKIKVSSVFITGTVDRRTEVHL
jgi:uncharacterized protein YhbP (UPF0306 family)